MRRTAALAAVALSALTFSGTALANHSGPEDIAKGRGETAASSSAIVLSSLGNTSFPGFTCTEPLIAFNFPFDTCTQTTTSSASAFDFDARLSGQEATTPLGESHGQMKLAVSTTTTTQVFVAGVAQSPANSVSSSFTATAEVTCLLVVNNRAAISGRVTRFSGTGTPQRGLLFNATDNTIAGTQVAPDEFAGTLVPEALQVCPAPGADAPITKGDILVEMN